MRGALLRALRATVDALAEAHALLPEPLTSSEPDGDWGLPPEQATAPTQAAHQAVEGLASEADSLRAMNAALRRELEASRVESGRLAATLCGVRDAVNSACPHCLGKLPHPPGPPCPPPRPGTPLWDAVAFHRVLTNLLKPPDGGPA